MPTYYLNPAVILLSDLDFKKVDLEPGTGQFVNSDFLIQDFGSMSNLSISVDRTVVDGRVVYYTDANNTLIYPDGSKFFSSDTASLPSFVSMNDLNGKFHPDFTNLDGNGDRVVDSPEDLLRGAIFTVIVEQVFVGVNTSQINFTTQIARGSSLFFDVDSTQNIVADILTKTESEFNREVVGGAEVSYWNGFTAENTVPQELSYVPFQDGDKLYTAYSLSLTFEPGTYSAQSSGLNLDLSAVAPILPFASKTVNTSFVLGWYLNYSGNNGAIDNMGGPLQNMTLRAYRVDENGAVATKALMPPLVSDDRGRTLIPPSWQ